VKPVRLRPGAGAVRAQARGAPAQEKKEAVMIIGTVIGNVWATKKTGSLHGLKLMIVRRTDVAADTENDSFVAVDCVGSGVGEQVLVVAGSSARKALRAPDIPVDAAIVGILDKVDVSSPSEN
jgi:ethanolamine utilization protein EutN